MLCVGIFLDLVWGVEWCSSQMVFICFGMQEIRMTAEFLDGWGKKCHLLKWEIHSASPGPKSHQLVLPVIAEEMKHNVKMGKGHCIVLFYLF